MVFQHILSSLKVGHAKIGKAISAFSGPISSSMFCDSVKRFIQEECKKVSQFRDMFDPNKVISKNRREVNLKKSNLHHIRCITPKRVTSGGVHLRG